MVFIPKDMDYHVVCQIQNDQEYIKKWLQNNAKPKSFGDPDRIIEITTLKGEMKYNKPVITVYPGKKIKLILRNNDDMHHNLAITKRGKGKDLKVAQEAWKLGAEGFAKHWIPDHPDLLFSTKMVDWQRNVLRTHRLRLCFQLHIAKRPLSQVS